MASRKIWLLSSVLIALLAILSVGMLIGLSCKEDSSQQTMLGTVPQSGDTIDKVILESTPSSSTAAGDVDSRVRPILDTSLPIEKRLSPGIRASVPMVSKDVDLASLSKVLMDTGDQDTVRNEVANLLRRSKYAGLTDALLAVLDNPAERPRFRSFAVQHLWQQVDGAGKEDQDRIRAKLHELLADRHVEVRREALLALVRMRDPVGQTTAVGWLTAKDPKAESTRDLAIRCVYDLGLREQMPVIRPFARDSNEVTRIAAIVALSQWGDEESREAFKATADSSSIRLQRAGKAALERLDQQERQPPMASTESAPKELKDEGAK